MDDQELEAHTMEMLAVMLVVAVLVTVALAMVWVDGTVDGVGFVGWLLGLLD